MDYSEFVVHFSDDVLFVLETVGLTGWERAPTMCRSPHTLFYEKWGIVILCLDDDEDWSTEGIDQFRIFVIKNKDWRRNPVQCAKKLLEELMIYASEVLSDSSSS